MNSIRRIREYIQGHGVKYTLQRLGEKAAQRYLGTYDRKRKLNMCPPEELALERENQPDAGLISVVVPVYNTDARMLKKLVECLREQTYAAFEAILYDGYSTREETLEVLEAVENNGDPRFRVIHGKENRGISGNTNDAVSFARGEYVALCDHDDLITPDALWRVAECIVSIHPDMIYSDEDRVAEDGRNYMDPHYKPDYCPDTQNSDNYICHLSVIRKSLYEEIGGLHSGMDGSQDHDLVLRISEKTDRICHLPYTLYSWREVKNSASHMDPEKCLENACKAVEKHEAKAGRKVMAKPVDQVIRLWYDIPEYAAVEAIVYGKTSKECGECFYELKTRTGWQNLSAGFVISTDREDLISEINRFTSESTCDYFLLMDAGIRGMNEDFIRELLMYAQRDDVAGVTPALVDSGGGITHGGYAVGVDGIARCICEGMHAGNGAGYNAMRKVHNVSAVSLGCVMVKKENWVPLDEGYNGGFAMVDLGMRQRQNGKWFVFTPHAKAVLARSALMLSSGMRENEDVYADMKRFEEKWGKEIHDPCYSGRFRKDKANYKV